MRTEPTTGRAGDALAGLPREFAPGVLWAGSCFELEALGEITHNHFCVYVIRGSHKTLMIDAGHPLLADPIERALDAFLDGRAVDYILPTHPEFPHCGLVPHWLERYPQAQVVGDIRDYALYYPEYATRLRQVDPGGSIDLGDRRVVVVPSIWADLTNTSWAFETKNRILFVSDGFSQIHYREPGACALTMSEMAVPRLEMMHTVNEITLQWTRFSDPTRTFPEVDRLLDILKPAYIAPAHGPVIDKPADLVPLIKEGMKMGRA